MAENGEEPIDQTPETPAEAPSPAPESPSRAPETPNRRSRTATIAHYLLMLGIVLIILSPLAYRTGLLGLEIALPMFPAGVVVSLLAVLVGLAGIVTTRNAAGRGRAMTAFVGGLIVVGIIGLTFAPMAMNGAPAIHDITTDVADAPVFVALKDARDAAPNETHYVGGETAAAQLAAFPDLQTMVVNVPGNIVFAAAEQVSAAMGWDIAASVPADGRIEATATTRIYGYKDDVVIRIRPTMDGTTEVDVRSASRVGLGDLGANAARISAFLAALAGALPE
jgi:uncharacterized protein (DUF1499 family)